MPIDTTKDSAFGGITPFPQQEGGATAVGDLGNLRIALRSALSEAAQQTTANRMQQLSGLVGGGAAPSVLKAAIGLAQSGLRTSQETIYKSTIDLLNRQQDEANNQLQMLISTGAITNITNTDLARLAESTHIPIEYLKQVREAKKSTGEAPITREVNGKLYQWDAKDQIWGLASGVSTEDQENNIFTQTQINNGAATANIPLADFSKLDNDTKNYFINNSSEINDKKDLIKTAKDNGEDPVALEKQISESNLPDAVKDTLVRYLWSVFPRPILTPVGPSWWEKTKSLFK